MTSENFAEDKAKSSISQLMHEKSTLKLTFFSVLTKYIVNHGLDKMTGVLCVIDHLSS